MSPEFWCGRRVFLTGHTGFKGGWLSLWLQSLGAVVTGYALKPPTEPSLFVAARVGEGMQSIIGDVRDLEFLKRSMMEAQPEIVFHMAAQPLVRYSYQNPVETFSTNVMGTVNVLEAVRFTPSVLAVINITTDKCYENREWIWGYREYDPMGGYDPYSSSKGCSELVSAAYRRSFFNSNESLENQVAIATARAGNVIGGGDWAEDRLIPDILFAFENNRPLNIRNPHAIRPWQHVLEPLRGYLVLGEKLVQEGSKFAEAWNFGPDDEDAKTVGWIVEQMANSWAEPVQWSLDAGVHPHEANYLKLDTSKARSRLNWRPALSLSSALKWIIDWSELKKEGGDMRALTQQQISIYQDITKEKNAK